MGCLYQRLFYNFLANETFTKFKVFEFYCQIRILTKFKIIAVLSIQFRNVEFSVFLQTPTFLHVFIFAHAFGCPKQIRRIVHIRSFVTKM